jgi:hypothetical protein
MTFLMSPRLPFREPSPEFALAAACCAWAIGRTDQLGEWQGAVDGERFLAIVRRHRIAGLAWQALAHRSDVLSASASAELEREGRRVASDGLRAAAECHRLQKRCAAEGIYLMFLKGLPVGKLAYGNALVKTSWDIDILVPDPDVTRAGALLRAMGYVGPEVGRLAGLHRVHKESTWIGANQTPVELHTRLADSPRLLAGVGTGSPRQQVEVVPGVVLPTLAGDALLAYLAVHGASSAWFRLKWIADFAGLLSGHSGDQVEHLAESMRELGAGRSVGQALLLANWLFGTPVPASVTQDRSHWRLARIACDQLMAEREPTARPLGTATIHWSQLLLRPGARFAVEEGARQLGEIAHRRLRR